MDCCVCTTMPLILRPPRNTICGACYEGARSILGLMNKLESDKPIHYPNSNSNSSSVSPPNSSKSLSDFKRWCLEQRDVMSHQRDEIMFLRSFVYAFRAQIHTDILVTPGKHGPPIPSHKALLATRSEIFKNMLDSDDCKAAATNNITIPELKHEELECLLEFLYSGTLDPQKLEKHVYALSLAADKYEIPHLQKHCERYMLISLSVPNALDVLEIADACSSQDLKNTAMKFLVDNIEDVVFSDRFEAFVHASPHLTLQLTRASAKGIK